jgi:hypothetical protein
MAEKRKRAEQAKRFMQPTQAQRRAAVAGQMLQGPRVTGAIDPVRERRPITNRIGEFAQKTPLAIPFGGMAEYLANTGSSRFRPRMAAAATMDAVPLAMPAAYPLRATRQAYNSLSGWGKFGVEMGANTVPNPFEEPRR